MGSLTKGATVVTLPDDFDFIDEHNWQPPQQSKTFSITGALIVQSNIRQAGRTITLQAADTYAWISRATLAQLIALADLPDVPMILEFRDYTFDVLYDFEAGAIEARPLVDFDTNEATDFFIATLRFITV